MKADILEDVRAFVYYYCPECHGKMRTVYLMPIELVCLKCNQVWELHWRKSKITIKQVREDGWLKDEPQKPEIEQ